MKLETYLSALGWARHRAMKQDIYSLEWEKYNRQALAFRARILRMDAEKDAEIKGLKKALD